MQVLITGGLGFIGSNLTDSLVRDGHDVIVLDNMSRAGVRHNLDWLASRHKGRFSHVHGDVRTYADVERAMKDAELVFHLAAQVAVTTSVADPRTDFDINALGTLHVLEAARQRKRMPVVFYTSTNKVYGGMENVRVVERDTRYEFADFPDGIAESFPLDFHSPYGCSKGAADQYVRDYFRIYGLRTVVFRMSCIYGPRQFGNEDQGWVAHFIINTLRDRPITIYGDGKQVRDLLYVEDLVNAFGCAARDIDATAGQVFNIGGGAGNTVSIWSEFEKLVQKSTGKYPRIERGTWRPGDQKIYVSDIRKARGSFSWQPRVSPGTGVERLAEWGHQAAVLLG